MMLRYWIALAACAAAWAATGDIARKTQGVTPRDGFVRFYHDTKAGKLWLEIERFDAEFLYLESLPAGLGSNDIGLDRGQNGESWVVSFKRTGSKVLLVAENLRYRTSSSEAAARRAVAESFAPAVLWGFEIAAEEDGRVLVDATSFIIRDAHRAAARVREADKSSYQVDQTRSALASEGIRNFPDNTELEALLTFTGGPPGQYLRDVAITADSFTLRQRHSFIRLPGPGYQPRAFDPRAGFGGRRFADLTAPLDQPMIQQSIVRHRLHKKDVAAAVSEPVKPIVYYLDRGAPEPIRSALLEGARWWNQAFESAGYKDAFRVELMPEGMDPMDIRYNIIQWVHRATRGWSYGGSIVDPRTGEIIKGMVTLGSLRARQDYLIGEALLGSAAAPEIQKMVLARLRQLAAHEVGHTLGLSHNYIASAQGDASVMDYPHPKITLNAAGEIDLSAAYPSGIGAWDRVAIEYGYRDFGGEDPAKLNAILAAALTRGLSFLSDEAARPPGSAHPLVHLWDNGADAAAELERTLRVRARALERFGEANVRPGQPVAQLAETLVPLYLLHRYQTEAAAKILGGLYYSYALRGDGQTATRLVPAADQRRALRALLATLDAKALALPEKLLATLPPQPHGYSRTRESFPARTGLTFDPIAAAETAASITVAMLLDPERAARLVEHHARDAAQPGLDEVIDALLNATWRVSGGTAFEQETRRATGHVVLDELMRLAARDNTSTRASAIAAAKLSELKQWCTQSAAMASDERAWRKFAAARISAFESDPKTVPVAHPVAVPPGQPIGDFEVF